MNILGYFLKRVKDIFSDTVENDELNSLYTQIANMDEELNVKENEISRLRARLKKYDTLEEKTVAKEESKAKPAPKKAASKKEPKTESKAKSTKQEAKAPVAKTEPKAKPAAKEAPTKKKASAKK